MNSQRVTRVSTFGVIPSLAVAGRVVLLLVGLGVSAAAPARGEWVVETVDDTMTSCGHQSSIAIDAARSPHVIYVNYNPASLPNGILRYAYKVSGSWVSENVAPVYEGHHGGTTLALDSQGQPHVTFATWSSTTQYFCRYAQKSGDEWVVENVPLITEFGDPNFFMALDSQDRPHVVYGAGFRLRHSYKTATGWIQETINSPESLVEVEAIGMNALDQPMIVFHTFLGENLRMATRQPNGTWTFEVIGTGLGITPGTASVVSLALDSSGNPYVTYFDWNIGQQRLAYRTDSGWTTVDAPSNGNGERGGLAAGSPGTAYRCYATTLPDLRSTVHLATWSGGQWTQSTVDQSPAYSEAYSLVLDASGGLHAGYRYGVSSYTGSQMRYARFVTTTAQTVRVPQDYHTIQSAIDAVTHDDTVEVSPGSYSENLDFRGKRIVVRSTSGPEVTIIDGGGALPVASFVTNEEEESTLQGFTLQNGASADDGGGVRIFGASPRIAGNVIRVNTADIGAGIGVHLGNPIIENNVIVDNHASSRGGAIAFRGDASRARVIGNRIEGNSSSGNAGGIHLGNSPTGSAGAGLPEIRRNVLRDNVAAVDGGGMYLMLYTSPLVSDNLFHRNTAGGRGGAMCWETAEFARGPDVINNTFVDNRGVTGPTILADQPNPNYLFHATIANNVMMGHGGGGLFHCLNVVQQVHHNDVFPWSGQAYGGTCPDLTGTDGNISVDPRLGNIEQGEFRLRADSPCIDVGSNSVPDLGSVDLGGLPRVVDWDGDGSAIVDLGAYEATEDIPVSTLAAFTGVWMQGGIELRWRFAAQNHVSDVEVQRAAALGGPWVALGGEFRSDGDVVSFLDTEVNADITHYYRLMGRSGDGLERLGLIAVGPQSTADAGALRVTPNPAHGFALVEFTVRKPSHVRVTVLDLQGRTVGTLANRPFPAGRQELRWSIGGSHGSPAGVLFVRFDVGGMVSVRRVVVVR